MTEHEMLEAVIEGYQVELHRVYLILKDWDTEQSRELATQISAGLPLRGEKMISSSSDLKSELKKDGRLPLRGAKVISSRLAELEAENLRLRSLLGGRDAE